MHTPGDLRLPVNDFSLTISKTGGDVSLTICNHIQAFMNNYCLKGAVATEVGQRAFNLHLQGVIKIHYPKTPRDVKNLATIIKVLANEW
jgi:hypothetical protein